MSGYPRRNLEHIVLPMTMYEIGEGLFAYLLREREKAVPLLCRLSSAKKEKDGPSPALFRVEPRRFQLDEGSVLVIRIGMP